MAYLTFNNHPDLALISVDDELILRSYEVADFEELFTVINNSRRHLGVWLNWVNKTSRPEHSLQFIQQSQDQMHNQEGLALGIFYKGAIIGGTGMHDWDRDTKRAQIGYWIAKEYEGKGIMMKCLWVLLAYLFNNAGLNKIEIHYVPTNKRSAKVATGLGFKLEGIIRHSCMRNGMPEDVVVTGLLKSEWKAAALQQTS